MKLKYFKSTASAFRLAYEASNPNQEHWARILRFYLCAKTLANPCLCWAVGPILHSHEKYFPK